MRVLFDHRVFSAQVVGGISRYFVETIRRLSSEAGVSVRVAAGLYVNRYLKELDRGLVSGLVVKPWRGTGRVRMVAGGFYSAAVAARFSPDIIHETYYGRPWPRFRETPTVITVYDMIHERLAVLIPPDKRAAHAQQVQIKKSSILRADLLLCISEKTRQDLLELCPVPAERTAVTHLGVDKTFATATRGESPRPRSYLLFVGSRGWYKDFPVLAKAVAGEAALKRDFELVCFGGGKFSVAELEMLGSLGLAGRVHCLDGSDQELLALYQHAHAFIFPSRYEGFGLPLLEAMAASCPVVASRASCFPEIAADAAEYFEPESPEDCARAVSRVVYDSTRRQALVELGQARRRQFTWEKTAQATLAAYRGLLGTRRTA